MSFESRRESEHDPNKSEGRDRQYVDREAVDSEGMAPEALGSENLQSSQRSESSQASEFQQQLRDITRESEHALAYGVDSAKAEIFFRQLRGHFTKLIQILSPTMLLPEDPGLLRAQTSSPVFRREISSLFHQLDAIICDVESVLSESISFEKEKLYKKESAVVKEKLVPLIERTDELLKNLYNLSAKVLEELQERERDEFPSFNSYQKQMESYGSEVTFDEYLQAKEENTQRSAEKMIGPVVRATELFHKLLLAPEEEVVLVDVNEIITQVKLYSTPGVSINLNSNGPLINAKPLALTFLIAGLIVETDERIQVLGHELLSKEASMNTISSEYVSSSFLQTAIGEFLYSYFLKGEAISVSVHDDASFEVSIETPALLADEVMALFVKEGRFAHFYKLADELGIALEVTYIGSSLILSFSPIDSGQRDVSSLVGLEETYGKQLLELPEADDDEYEYDVDVVMPDEDSGYSEEDLNKFLGIIRSRGFADGTYFLGLQGAGFLLDEGRVCVDEYAQKLDRVMSALPRFNQALLYRDMSYGAEVKKNAAFTKRVEDVDISEVYRSGKFDFIKITHSNLGTETIENLSEYVDMLRRNLRQALSWVPAVSISRAKLMCNPKLCPPELTFSPDFFNSDTFLPLLENVTTLVGLRHAYVTSDKLEEFCLETNNSLDMDVLFTHVVEVLEETQKVLTLSQCELSLFVDIVAHRGVEHLYYPAPGMIIWNEEGEAVFKAHLSHETGRFVGSYMNPEDTKVLRNGVRRAVDELLANKEYPDSQVSPPQFVAALQKQEVAISLLHVSDCAMRELSVLYPQTKYLDWLELALESFSIYVKKEADGLLHLRVIEDVELTAF